MKSDTTYLSIVLACRNDNYGGDFNIRLQNCINWFAHFADKFGLNSEIIIINYNPVLDEKPLTETINFPKSKSVSYRIITVPQSFHEKISDEDVRKKLPMYEYIAKNIGIRRAIGEYILSANPDILIDPAIIYFMAKRKMKANFYYRANRADYDLRGKEIEPFKDLKRVRQSVFRIFMKGYKHSIKAGTFSSYQLLKKFLINRLKIWYNLQLVKHEDFANKYTIPITYDNIALKIHANCSGDFMLMHNSKWYKLRGHPQNTYLSIHTDALMVAMAFFSGLKEKTFFYPVYHQNHERRFVADNSNPHIYAMFRHFEDEGKRMEQLRTPIIYNQEDWGFINENFEEIQIV